MSHRELPSERAAGEAWAVWAPALPVAVGCAGMQGVPSLEGMVERLGGDGNRPCVGGSSQSVPIISL